MVTFRFGLYGKTEQTVYFRIGGPVSKCRFQVDFGLGKKAGPQLAVRRQSEPVAVFTEVMADGAYEAYDAFCPFQSEISRRAVFPQADRLQRTEGFDGFSGLLR